MTSSFLEQVLGYAKREGLITQCPSLALFCYQEFVAAIQGKRRVVDPLAVDDGVAVLLSATSVSQIMSKVFAEASENETQSFFWRTLREALEGSWDPEQKSNKYWRLYEVEGKPHFYARGTQRRQLTLTSLQNALAKSRKVLKQATACALAGSIEPLAEERTHPIAAMLQYSRIVPPSSQIGVVTSEGLSFCMQPLQQQWWTLLSVALDRVLALTNVRGVTRAHLWQLLTVLFALDSSQFVYPFPAKENDFAAFHLLARLSEVGLVYPLLCDGERCFILSPHFHHAVCWGTTAPLCTAALLGDEKGATHSVRREDEDTIITETNFRLYAYTRNPELLNILDQFAVKEAEVDRMIVCYRVTRSSFAAGLRRGINSLHILQFLAVKAHPSMLKRHDSDKNNISSTLSTSSVDKRFRGAFDIRIGEIIPQSFCDQLMTWEKECRRLIFSHNVVLLRNVSAVQRDILLKCLLSNGYGHAVVHQEGGYLVVQREAYERVLALLI